MPDNLLVLRFICLYIASPVDSSFHQKQYDGQCYADQSLNRSQLAVVVVCTLCEGCDVLSGEQRFPMEVGLRLRCRCGRGAFGNVCGEDIAVESLAQVADELVFYAYGDESVVLSPSFALVLHIHVVVVAVVHGNHSEYTRNPHEHGHHGDGVLRSRLRAQSGLPLIVFHNS